MRLPSRLPQSGTAIRHGRRAQSTLAFEEIEVPGPPPEGSGAGGAGGPAASEAGGDSLRTAIVVHGLLGTGRNWRSPIRSLGAAVKELSPPGAPGWRFVLVDLRNHGQSAALKGLRPPHTIRAAAQDLVDLVAANAAKWRAAEAVIGHSLGGKVALEYLRRASEGGGRQPHLKQVWVLDSVPGANRDDPGGGDVERVLEAIQLLPSRVPSRSWLIKEMGRRGFSRPLAEWLASNLRRPAGPPPDTPPPGGGGGLEEMTWLFDVEGAAQMYNSYREEDYLSTVERLPAGVRLDFVRAARSDRWTPGVLEALEAAMRRSSNAHIHVLEDAGHWLHVDNPKGLVKLIAPSLV